ncbi:MAG: GNAT family N-acetyltransferase [Pseudomonadota bacterium]
MIEIVPGTADDREVVAGYIGQLYRAAYDMPTPEEALLARADEMLAAGPVRVLRKDGETIGYAAYKEMGDHVFVRHFVIDETLRRTGLGARAFDALEDACFGGRQVRLDATHERPGPRAFWESKGFSVMGYTMKRDARDTS